MAAHQQRSPTRRRLHHPSPRPSQNPWRQLSLLLRLVSRATASSSPAAPATWARCWCVASHLVSLTTQHLTSTRLHVQVQHLVRGGHDVHCTYTSGAEDWQVPGATTHRVDFATKAGLDECLFACGSLDAVVNCAAISQPVACAKTPGLARAINVPTALLAALRGTAPNALFVHLSTDHVYEGTRPWWTEDDAPSCVAVNAYGASKREAEAAVTAQWRHYAILRSSAIIGPVQMPYKPVSRSVFTQWLDTSLAAGTTNLFEDEFRSPVYIHDICAAVDALLRTCVPEPGQGREPGGIEHRVFNLGGPERLSRADMGDALVAVRGYPRDRVVRVPCSSVVRDPPSPQDISMDVQRVQRVLGIRLTPFGEALREIFGPPAC